MTVLSFNLQSKKKLGFINLRGAGEPIVGETTVDGGMRRGFLAL
jgi:hypothetical protein